MLNNRRKEVELYKLYVGDAAFKKFMQESLRRSVEL